MDVDTIRKAIADIRKEGWIPMSIYMNESEYKSLIKWSQRNMVVRAHDRFEYTTPRYMNIPIITDEGVPDGQWWITKSRHQLEADIVEIGE